MRELFVILNLTKKGRAPGEGGEGEVVEVRVSAISGATDAEGSKIGEQIAEGIKIARK